MKICIISVYFGKFPNYFKLWLKSCSYNVDIDFRIVTDQSINIELPTNVRLIQHTLKSFKSLAETKIGRSIRLETPYKCCDYKPFYGLILEDYLTEYDFWGHCDLDLLFGDIRKFVTDDILNNYKKIYHLGHFSLYHNDPIINTLFKQEGSIRCSWEDVISTDKICVFDEELGIDKIFEKNNVRLYNQLDFVDIEPFLERIACVVKPFTHNNYDNQLFCFEDGHCYRYYVKGKEILRDEFVYLHMQRRKFADSLPDTSRFAIGPHSFIALNKSVDVVIINEINPYTNIVKEKIEHTIKLYSFLVNRKLKGTHL